MFLEICPEIAEHYRISKLTFCVDKIPDYWLLSKLPPQEDKMTVPKWENSRFI